MSSSDGLSLAKSAGSLALKGTKAAGNCVYDNRENIAKGAKTGAKYTKKVKKKKKKKNSFLLSFYVLTFLVSLQGG